MKSDHTALKRITDPSRGFQSLRRTKATLKGIKAVRMINCGHVCDLTTDIIGQIRLLAELSDLAA